MDALLIVLSNRSKSRLTVFIALFALIFVAAGCADDKQPEETTSVLVVVTNTPASAEPTPQPTPRPTIVPVTEDPLTAEPTIPPTPEENPDDTILKVFPELVGVIHNVMPHNIGSPSGQWSAFGVLSDPVTMDNGSEQYFTGIAVTDGTVTNRLAGEWRPYGLGLTLYQAYRWSFNSRYLYYTNGVLPDGCAIFINGIDLYRYNLRSGETTKMLGPNVGYYPAEYISLSPDETKLAYIYRKDDVLWIAKRLVNTDIEIKEPLIGTGQNTQAGNILWSPDEYALVLTIANQPCTPDWTQTTLWVDTRRLGQELLIIDDTTFLSPTTWIDDSTIEVVNGDNEYFDLDIFPPYLNPKDEPIGGQMP